MRKASPAAGAGRTKHHTQAAAHPDKFPTIEAGPGNGTSTASGTTNAGTGLINDKINKNNAFVGIHKRNSQSLHGQHQLQLGQQHNDYMDQKYNDYQQQLHNQQQYNPLLLMQDPHHWQNISTIPNLPNINNVDVTAGQHLYS